jgi:sec-independent protein translocase protein TatA
MVRLGPTELILILLIVILLFGVGRIGKIAGELGSGLRAFREGLQGPEKDKEGEKKGEEIGETTEAEVVTAEKTATDEVEEQPKA